MERALVVTCFNWVFFYKLEGCCTNSEEAKVLCSSLDVNEILCRFCSVFYEDFLGENLSD